MVRLRPLLIVLSTAALLLAAAGCDPKLTGTEGDDPSNPDPTPAQVAPEARIAASLLMMHLDAITASLSVSSVYAGGSPAPMPRFLTDGCITVSLEDALARIHSVEFSGCEDANGTSYTGGADLSPVPGEDAYILQPSSDTLGILIATNSESPEFYHIYQSGSLKFTFGRDASDVVTSVQVSNFLRHLIGEAVVTFSYDGVIYNGAVGQHADWPATGGILRVVWDGVGIFDVTLLAGGSATFTLGGTPYQVDFATGTVSISQ